MYKDYVTLLKDHCLKVTHPRLEILSYLDKHHDHPTAEQIYSTLKKTSPSLSKTTVYNALETLEHHHIIQTLTISGTEHHYDMRSDMHHHFLCKNCHKIIDIDIKCPNIQKVEDQGFEIEEVHGYFKGICKECAKKMGRND